MFLELDRKDLRRHVGVRKTALWVGISADMKMIYDNLTDRICKSLFI